MHTTHYKQHHPHSEPSQAVAISSTQPHSSQTLNQSTNTTTTAHQYQQSQRQQQSNSSGFMQNPQENYSYHHHQNNQNQAMNNLQMLPLIQQNQHNGSSPQFQNYSSSSSHSQLYQFIPHPNTFGQQFSNKEKNGASYGNNKKNSNGNKGAAHQGNQGIFNQFFGNDQNQPSSSMSQNQNNSQQQQQHSSHYGQLQQQQQGGQLQQKQQQQKQQQYILQQNQGSNSALQQTSLNGATQQFRYKTHKCRHFLSGNCTLGEKCNFAHSEKELRDPQDPLPPNISVGQKVQITNFKTIKCRYYDNGFCKNSEKCSFAHGNQELLTPGVTLNNINAFPQQNQIQMNEIQKEQMRKESIEQQNNFEFYRNNLNDVINELKYGFPANAPVLQQLDEAISQLKIGDIEMANRTLFSIFEDNNRTNQDRQHILSTIKKYNDHYKDVMEKKYKSEQIGYNQSNFFQHSSFEGFSQDTQIAYMNAAQQQNNVNNANSSQINNASNNTNGSSSNINNNNTNQSNPNNSASLPQHSNSKSISSTTTSNSNQGNGSSYGVQQGPGSANNIASFHQQNLSNNSSCNSNSGSDYERKDVSPYNNKLNNYVSQQLNCNDQQENSSYDNNTQGQNGEEDEQQNQQYSVNEMNQIFQNFNLESNSNNQNTQGGASDYLDAEMLLKKKQIQDIFSSDNSNLIIFKNQEVPIDTEK